MGVFERIETAKRLNGMVSLAGPPPVLSQAVPRAPSIVLDTASPSIVETRAALRAELAQPRTDIPSVAEIIRITSLSAERELTPREVDAVSKREVLASVYESGWRLKETQARTLLWYDRLGGVFCPIGVGKGKTLITIMIAERAFKAGNQKIILVMPPGACLQFAIQGLPFARRHVPVSVPFHFLAGKSLAKRRTLARSGKLGVYVMPCSLFSTKDTRTVDGTEGILDAIAPKLLIIDEAHKFKRRRVARTNRLMSYIDECSPAGVCLSGTVTNKSIEDYHHLIRWCLGTNSPLPLSGHMAQQWGQIIDADADPTPGMTGPLRPLIDWARGWFPSESFSDDKTGFRRAFRLRLTSAPGVVASGDEDLGVSLTIKTVPVEKPEKSRGWEELQGHIKQVEELWLTPNGDEIEHAFHTYKWMHELSAGFYNLLSWPDPKALEQRRNLTARRAVELVEAAKAHHEARQEYARALRAWLEKYQRAGLDTPMLIGANMSRVGPEEVGRALYDPWKLMKDLEEAAIPEWDKQRRVLPRDSHAVQVCDYKVKAALEWASSIVSMKENKGKFGAIIWYHHIEIGEWLASMAAEMGLDFLHAPAGHVSNKALADTSNATKVVIASIGAHGEAKELQHFRHQYVLQWPRSAKTGEQLLGRCHRQGQQADELFVVKADSIDWDVWNFATCLNNALYIQQTLGTGQKMVYCGYDPMPKIFPPEILRERGFEGVRRLDQEGRSLMEDLFGPLNVD